VSSQNPMKHIANSNIGGTQVQCSFFASAFLTSFAQRFATAP
jgi:hypothetical protein